MAARRLYFAYGANLSEEAMHERCPSLAARKLGAATLPDYRLEFCRDDNGFGIATIAPARGRQVLGGLWRINRACLAILNIFEAYPRVYTQKWVRVLYRGKTVSAMTYVLRDRRPAGGPDPDYLNTIRMGYRDFGLDDSDLERAVQRSRRQAARLRRWKLGR
ncbi:MAG: gamma-glutamylcyclotransferase family protein [bacterium]|nr:gamma-glutamylcyclotransferase family protein [bacterium]